MSAPHWEREAKARLAWGHQPDDVVEALKKLGATPEQARTAVDAQEAGRNREYRIQGFGSFILGAGLLALAVYLWKGLENRGDMGTRGYAAVLVALVIAGAVLMGIGVDRMARGGEGDR